MFSQDDEYGADVDSEEGNVDSSDDEIDVILRGTPEQKRRLRRRSIGEKSSSGDEFEKEMEKELNSKMTVLENEYGKPSKDNAKGGKRNLELMTEGTHAEQSENSCYDQIYFDSDSDDDGTREEKSKRMHPVISNDDLLYDPDMDDEDQRWVDRERQSHQPKNQKLSAKNKGGKKSQPAPSSDAVLDCPACLTTLCIDCQRHDIYKHQYRAMFVMNCQVDTTEKLKYPEPKPKISKKKQKRLKENDGEASTSEQQSNQDSSNDLYNSVKCKECNTLVGVYDADEVYHFFNILASYS